MIKLDDELVRKANANDVEKEFGCASMFNDDTDDLTFYFGKLVTGVGFCGFKVVADASTYQVSYYTYLYTELTGSPIEKATLINTQSIMG